MPHGQCCVCNVVRRLKARGLCFTCYNFYYRKGLIPKKGNPSRPYLMWSAVERQVILDCVTNGLTYSDVCHLLPGRTRKQFNSVLWNVRHNAVAWTKRPKAAIKDREPTAEEIERTVDEQRLRLPDWWGEGNRCHES